ncbi:hypothetical protein ACF09E_34860 [Streptomyces sp. NPDC014891]|uniref:hypothetical protein n=1 Tax=Streptomyces sp. NPDC014891 TaxID=3364929 RepID=UPI0036F5BEE3
MDLNRTPETIAYAAAQEVQALNHLTFNTDVFTYPAEVQSTACGLNKLLLNLPQSLSQLIAGLNHVEQIRELRTHDGSDVGQAVEGARADLANAVAHARLAQQALQAVVDGLAVVGARYVPADDEELSDV